MVLSPPGASQVAPLAENLPADAQDVTVAGSIPGLGRSPGGGHSNPLQYSRLENPMDRGAWRAIVAKSRTRLKRLSTHTCPKWTRAWVMSGQGMPDCGGGQPPLSLEGGPGEGSDLLSSCPGAVLAWIRQKAGSHGCLAISLSISLLCFAEPETRRKGLRMSE